MNGLQKNLYFLAFLAKKANFGQFFVKMGKTEIFLKKACGKFLWHLQALTNCKVSEKSNKRFSSNRVTYGRTDRRTRILKVYRLRRETNFYPERDFPFPSVKIVLSTEKILNQSEEKSKTRII